MRPYRVFPLRIAVTARTRMVCRIARVSTVLVLHLWKILMADRLIMNELKAFPSRLTVMVITL